MASIEKRSRSGPTVWRARYRTPDGAQRSKSFARKVDAQRFLASIESAKVAGTYVDPGLAQVTVGEWAELWLRGQTHLKPSTHARYAGIIRTHVKPKRAHGPSARPAFPQVRTAFRTCTPDRIRTGATAVKERPRGCWTMLEISGTAGQGHNWQLAVVERNWHFLDLVLPQCCPEATIRPTNL